MRRSTGSHIYLLSLILSLLILLPSLAFSSNPSSGGSSSAPVTIEFWHAMKPGTPRGEAINYLVEKFNQEHPDIRVISRFKGSKKGNPYNQLFRELLISLSLGKPPAIAQSYENWTLQFLASEKLLPLHELVKDDPQFKAQLSDFLRDFYRSNVVNGELVSLPFNKSIYVLYYNEDIFDAFGIKPPRTWDDLRKISKYIYDNTEIYGIAINPTVDTFVAIYLTRYDKPLFRGLHPVFAGYEGIATLNYLKALTDQDKSAVVSRRAYHLFVKGEAAMVITTTSKYERFKRKANFKVGIAPLPLERGKYPFAGTNLVIFRDIPREKQLAAYTFLKWLLKPENVLYFAMHTGYIPVRKSALQSEKYQKYLQENPEFKSVLDATLGKLEPQPPVWAWENVRYYLTEAVTNVLIANSSPEEALKRAEDLTLKIIQNQKLYKVEFRYGE